MNKITRNIEDKWKDYLNEYSIPTCLKEHLLKSYFETINIKPNVLDVGCGTGYFTELFNNKNIKTIGVDRINKFPKNKHKQSEYIQIKNTIPFKDSTFKTTICINVLSCISEEQKRIKLLSEIKRVKTNLGTTYLVICSEDIYKKKINSDLIKTEQLENDVSELTFKQINGNSIKIIDHFISEKQIKKYCNIVGFKIKEKKYFKYNNNNIYTLFKLK